MPRPRVPLENRKRCVTACVQCRVSKKKCDSRQPCQKCVAKGEPDRCFVPVERPGIDSKGSGRNSIVPVAQKVVPEPSSIEAQVSSGVLSSPRQRSILLRASRDERIYFGNTAAISFLKFLQQTWRTYVEPNDFTEDQGTHQMLEVEMPSSTTPLVGELSIQNKRHYVECYLHASSFSPENILDPETNHDILLDLMIAIGAQCQARTNTDNHVAMLHFKRAQIIAFSDMLQAPTVNLARAFALMAFFMLGACNRNPALMYVGIASNISVILGLHSPESYQQLPVEKREARLQTGKSIRVLDLICNTILGRPGSTPVISSDDEYLDGEICPNYATLCAVYEVVAVLQLVVNETKENEGASINKAEQCLVQLREWSSRLPTHLRRQTLGDSSAHYSLETRRATIGKIHLACIYYYGVIQITRQFLVDHIIPSVYGESREGVTDNRTLDLAKMCTEAALFMAQMCDDAENAGAFLGNMCILKAWLFSAGLVLGCSLLQLNDHAEDIRHAFHATSKILGRFGRNSQQAKQYHGILSNFADAIANYQRKSRMKRLRLENSNVERILAFDEPNDQQPVAFQTQTNMSPSRVASVTIINDDSIGTFESDDHLLQWNWPVASENNEILRMFLDPCLEHLMNLPPPDFT
uniref:Filamentous growth regulator 27 n=1 Tax=Talaromyces marneffei PM1 TaxID=1077442 RepID=A0A093ULZ1_TALMA